MLNIFTHAEASDKWLEVWDDLISDAPMVKQATTKEQVKSFAKLLTSDTFDVACKYPARTYLVAQLEGLYFNELIAECSELNEFISKVPFEKLSLVFASEEISSPASVMGHVFLQVDGTDKSGRQKSYALSYLTTLDGFNLPYLTYSLLIGGRNGFLTLGRAETEIAKYVDYSKRTVWLLPLDSKGQDLTFLQLYIWELRQNPPDYYFVTLNCATLLDHLLSITHISQSSNRSNFLTPRSLFKRHAENREKLISVYPSIDWTLRSMGAASTNKTSDVRKSIISGDISWLKTETNPKNLLFASSYAEKLRRSKKISDETTLRQVAAIDDRLNELGINPDEFYVQNYKNPIHTTPPSRLYTGFVNRGNTGRILLGYRPVARDLMASGKQYFSQQESILGLTEVSITPGTKNFRLEKLVLFSMKSLIPHTTYAPSPSFAVDLKVERNIRDKLASRFHGVWGQSRKISPDTTGYILFGGGVGNEPDEDKHIYAASEVGLFFELVMNSRARIAHEAFAWGFDRNKVIEKRMIEFQKDFGLSSSIAASWTKLIPINSFDKDTEVFEVRISKYF